MLSNLGVALRNRFEQDGAQADLEAAVEVAKTAVDSIPVGHPASGLSASATWGKSLLARFRQTGELTDPGRGGPGQPGRCRIGPRQSHAHAGTYLSGLQNALDARGFERTGAIADLDAAVQAGRAAVAGTLSRPP